MLDAKVRQAVQRDYGMAERNSLMACPPPYKTESGELVDWAVTTHEERQDHFKTVDKQFEETFGEHV